MYNALGELQNWRCAACGREAKTMPLNVDHFHFKIEARRSTPGELSYFPNNKWFASTEIDGQPITARGATKIAAMAAVREQALPRSVRGLLCAGRYAGCNRKLGRIDNVPWLTSIITYLNDPPARKIVQDFSMINAINA